MQSKEKGHIIRERHSSCGRVTHVPPYLYGLFLKTSDASRLPRTGPVRYSKPLVGWSNELRFRDSPGIVNPSRFPHNTSKTMLGVKISPKLIEYDVKHVEVRHTGTVQT